MYKNSGFNRGGAEIVSTNWVQSDGRSRRIAFCTGVKERFDLQWYLIKLGSDICTTGSNH